MKRRRHTPEQAVRKVREGERMLGSGIDLTEVLRHLEIRESTWYRWRRTYAGMTAEDAKRPKKLEAENTRGEEAAGVKPSWTRPCSRISPRQNGNPASAVGWG